ncbi:ATP-dependent DNA helicase RecQ [Cellulomonas marina]|uniref:DNA helicase RecQ n=2 Tax=Cellulomonas marina TaxID=988821 RepID=A0A1I0WSF9_9CELL|nr:ATP-dependent DNA helicase RecQ [Cellulomonas marina]
MSERTTSERTMSERTTSERASARRGDREGGGRPSTPSPAGTEMRAEEVRAAARFAGRDPVEVLREVWGYEGFRGDQAAVVQHVVDGGDALVLMPTGAGKSLCYQVPALVRPGTGVVVSPLIALMQDQVDALSALGVRAGFLNSSQDAGARRATEEAFLAGELDLLYLAPERLVVRETVALLDRGTVALFAIDEAHCVSQWGHDFRPEYLQLALLEERWPDVPRIALTATATEHTRAEIATRLQLEDALQVVASFDRPNIRYRIEPKDNPRAQLLRLIRTEHDGDCGIVYCLSRNSVEQTAAFLVGEDIPALPYHAGLDRRVRQENQARFLREDGLVMVATIAFGMGIDKPDVRFVAHLDLPKSVEGYYQETGRAGRDGLPSTAWLAYGLADVVQQRRLIDTSDGDAAHRRRLTAHLDAMLALCETVTCRRQGLLAYFGQPSEPCGNCDTCLTPPQTWDGTVAAQKLLFTVVRLDQRGQRYGVGHVVDVLRGKTTPRVTQLGHTALSTFGIGADTSEAEWRGVVRQLLARELLAVDTDGYGTLRLTEGSAGVLRGATPVPLRREEPRRPSSRGDRRGGGSGSAGKAAADLDGDAAARFEALRAWRATTAREQGVPAYVVFHDATLRDIAARRPATTAELAGVSGVGAAKLERYGAGVLAALGAGPGTGDGTGDGRGDDAGGDAGATDPRSRVADDEGLALGV